VPSIRAILREDCSLPSKTRVEIARYSASPLQPFMTHGREEADFAGSAVRVGTLCGGALDFGFNSSRLLHWHAEAECRVIKIPTLKWARISATTTGFTTCPSFASIYPRPMQLACQEARWAGSRGRQSAAGRAQFSEPVLFVRSSTCSPASPRPGPRIVIGLARCWRVGPRFWPVHHPVRRCRRASTTRRPDKRRTHASGAYRLFEHIINCRR